ncbi:replicative DNA helicase [Ralstonia phage Hyacinthe]|uniref:DNA 5'-3' helicase n=3 Tax=Rahariannevirus raharianne TaxID=2846050 RepID=A0A7G5BBA3_9CAUD|nr:DnaB-like replicative helicase [Ralstonia phage Raharianne]QMV32382.1 replicative DNA helicase [Ralstonia phage Albius]QMV33496.1 replicative DNA helicase [Ralstonia phage Hyacinthe]QMV33576.1 replicative DNA helicase [Ralstonia phage Raharianne]
MTARDDFATPQSIEAEQSILGALMLDNDAIDRVDGLAREHFYRADHAAIFGVICELITAGQPADVVTVYERFAAKGDAEHIGGLAYLNALAQATPSSANVGRYAAVVRDKAVKRQLLTLAADVPEMVVGSDEARIVVDRVQSKLEALAQQRVKSEPVRASDDLGNYFDQLQAEAEGTVKAIPTGFQDLDAKLGGGMRGGELLIVAGRPAMGKTAFALNICNNVAWEYSALVLSMEMPKAQLHQRNIAMLGKVQLRRLRVPTLMTEDDWRALTVSTAKIADMNLYLDDQPALTLLEVRSKARVVKRKNGLDLLVVDYLGLMTGGPSENRNQEVGSYSRGLKALAKELDIPIIALAQLNRGLESRADKRPSMADLRDSGEIEQDADAIMFLYRDEVYHPDSQAKGICEVLIAKQRQGETGMVPLAYQGEYTLFSDLQRGYTPPEPRQAGRHSLRGDM